MAAKDNEAALTAAGAVFGTPRYMAPEQFTNSRDSRPAVDLFACGGCLFRMLTGALPKAATEPEETIRILDAAQAIPEPLRQVVRKAISISPEDRYPDAESFVKALFPFHKRT